MYKTPCCRDILRVVAEHRFYRDGFAFERVFEDAAVTAAAENVFFSMRHDIGAYYMRYIFDPRESLLRRERFQLRDFLG